MVTLKVTADGRRLTSSVTINVDLSETNLRGTEAMRLVFNTTLTVDVNPNDDELRAAFIELVTQSARTVYGPAAMLAKSKPILKLTITDRRAWPICRCLRMNRPVDWTTVNRPLSF